MGHPPRLLPRLPSFLSALNNDITSDQGCGTGNRMGSYYWFGILELWEAKNSFGLLNPILVGECWDETLDRAWKGHIRGL